jgi:glycosyltransferase involved in cell wall biosynthesis
MRLCIPVAIFPPEIGGPATYVPELAKRLAQRGHEVHVVTFGTPEHEERDGYHIHRQAYPELPKFLAFPLRIFRAGLLCARVVKKYNLEVIYAQEYLSGLMGLIAKKLTGRRLYFKYVGDWAWEVAFARGWTDKLLHEFYNSGSHNFYTTAMMHLQRLVGKSSTKIIVPSSYLKSVIEKWCASTPVVVIPNAVEFNPCDSERCRRELGLEGFTLLSVGRLVRWKGFQLVIEAIKDIDQEVSYLIVGDGPYRRKLEELAERLNLNNVHFLGKMPKSRTLKYICASDLFVLPSCYEGMSHVILEAMSCRTPVLASDIPPNRELIEDGKTGFLVDPAPAEIRKKISEILDRGNLNEIAERAYEAVKNRNSWENHITKLEEVIKYF